MIQNHLDIPSSLFSILDEFNDISMRENFGGNVKFWEIFQQITTDTRESSVWLIHKVFPCS